MKYIVGFSVAALTSALMIGTASAQVYYAPAQVYVQPQVYYAPPQVYVPPQPVYVQPRVYVPPQTYIEPRVVSTPGYFY